MKRLLMVVLCAVAGGAQGDTLGEMNAAVRRLAGRQPVRATLAIEQAVKSAGKFANDATSRVGTCEISHDGTGVSIVIPQALVERASVQRHDADERNTAKDAIGAIRSLDVIDALNFRDAFLVMTHGAKVLSEKRVVFRGRAARQLALKLDPKPEKDAGSIRIGKVETDDRMTVWVGDDGLPLAAERSLKTTGGFLFIKGTFSARTSYSFAHAPDRLLLARVEITEGGSGMGQKVEKKSVQTLTLR